MANATAWISQLKPITILNAWKGRDSVGLNTTSVVVAPTVGKLVACIASFHDAITSVVDNINTTGTGWNKAIDVHDTTSNRYCAIWYYMGSVTGINTITVSSTDVGGGFMTIVVHEVQNISTFTPGEGLNSQSGTANPITQSLTNSVPNSIFFAVVECNSATVTFTVNAVGTLGPWALFDLTNSQELDNNTYEAISVPNAQRFVSQATVHAWTQIASAWSNCIACFS